MTGERHIEVAGPNWDTKVRCSCGHEETNRAQMWKHQAEALRAELDDEHGPITPENQVGVETAQAPSKKEGTQDGN